MAYIVQKVVRQQIDGTLLEATRFSNWLRQISAHQFTIRNFITALQQTLQTQTHVSAFPFQQPALCLALLQHHQFVMSPKDVKMDTEHKADATMDPKALDVETSVPPMPHVPPPLRKTVEDFISAVQFLQKIKNFQESLRQHLFIFQVMLRNHYETHQKLTGLQMEISYLSATLLLPGNQIRLKEKLDDVARVEILRGVTLISLGNTRLPQEATNLCQTEFPGKPASRLQCR